MEAATIVKPIQDIISKNVQLSQLFPYGGLGYKSCVSHYLESSCEVAAAAIEPGSVDDLAEIMQFLAANKNTSFAVKGGGHTSNPKFSSTTGIQISMTRFNKIRYDESTKNLHVGSGCLFDEVYLALPEDRNIVGGSGIAGVGVAGWLLGGGYSLKTNQFGLGIDNLLGFKIVLPNGDIKGVTEESDPDLFWAVKGGGNNFGIIVEFTLKTHPQPEQYTGTLLYDSEQVNDVKGVIVKFLERPAPQDPKAAIIAAFRHYNTPKEEKFKLTVQCFYDGPKPNPDPFQPFLNIPHQGKIETRTHRQTDQEFTHINKRLFEGANSDHVGLNEREPMAGIGENARGRWGNVMVGEYDRDILDEVEYQAKEAAKDLKKHSGKMVVVDNWPFVTEMFDNSPPAAWPHEKGKPNGPLLVYFLWEGEENDDYWVGLMEKTLKVLATKVCDHDNRPIYSNTTLAKGLRGRDHTTVKDVYRNHLDRLSKIRKRYDPNDVMGRAGGFRIPLV